jgi:transcriptional regulator with XRE-family HTH domain
MLAEALRLIRVYHDIKQQDLAVRLGMSKSYISELESGKKVPSFDVIQKYADEFGIPPSSILFFAENIKSPSKASQAKSVIANKIIRFLQFIETKTSDEHA